MSDKNQSVGLEDSGVATSTPVKPGKEGKTMLTDDFYKLTYSDDEDQLLDKSDGGEFEEEGIEDQHLGNTAMAFDGAQTQKTSSNKLTLDPKTRGKRKSDNIGDTVSMLPTITRYREFIAHLITVVPSSKRKKLQDQFQMLQDGKGKILMHI